MHQGTTQVLPAIPFDLGASASAAVPVVAIAVVVAAVLFAYSKWRAAHHARQRLGAWLSSAGVIALCAACVFACSMLQWGTWAKDADVVSSALSEQGSLNVELLDDGADRDYGTVSLAQAHIGNRDVRLRLMWPQGASVPGAGHSVLVAGSVKAPQDDAGGRWSHRQGYVGMLNAKSVEDCGYAAGLRGWVAGVRDKAAASIAKLDQDAAGLLAGVVLGNRTLYAQTELEQDFRTCGLAHLMAVSGTHLAVVSALVMWIASRFKIRRAVKSALLLVLLGAYVALTCFAPSAMRAYVMCAAVLTAPFARRRNHAVGALAICVVLFLACDGSLAFFLGFELSVLCMVGLLVLSPLVAEWFKAALGSRLDKLADGLAATFAANLATLPVTIPLFCQVPLISPLSTLLVSPLVTLVLGLGIPAALACSVFPALGEALLQPAALAASACAKLVCALADMPMACVPVQAQASWVGFAFGACGVALWLAWPLPRQEIGLRCKGALLRLRCAVVAAALLPVALVVLSGLSGLAGGVNLVVPGAVSYEPQVVMLDVGQGDAMLVTCGNASVLVDTGQEGTVLLEALARHGITRLDAVLLSHKDADHTGALSALAGVVEVGHVYIHADLLAADSCAAVRQAALWVTKGAGAQGVRSGDVLSVGSISLRLLAPAQGGQSENDDSLVWLLSASDDEGKTLARGLLTGDAEQAALENVAAQAGDVDFLKVGHHGSADAVSDAQMRILRPELALISVGADNDYGHPTQSTLSVLERGGAQVLRTDQRGDITLGFEEGRICVATQKAP